MSTEPRNVRASVEIDMRVPDVASPTVEPRFADSPGYVAYLAGQLDDESYERVASLVHGILEKGDPDDAYDMTVIVQATMITHGADRARAERRPFGDLAGASRILASFQGGRIVLRGHGCTHCDNAFWVEDDPARRLAPGPHPCPHCATTSTILEETPCT